GRNVRDLYTFLARNYRPGDRIFLFGFSRGAATVRAFSGFVATCGLIDGHAMTDAELERETLRKFRQYRDGKPDLEEPGLHPDIKITFIGVWDTVSALGFPRRTDITSTFMNLLNRAFVALDKVTDHIPWLRHNFYQYGITGTIEIACQALARDGARTSFWPAVW
ncbi:MAG: DUF2235 domain-containing protein, partial [Pseudomonadales bacterium]|nr:DUF2235 domain-containing protein [Pseudomonadales bacterium]